MSTFLSSSGFMGLKSAFITGIAGQDGSFLAEYLLERGYEVHGLVRRSALENPGPYLWRLSAIYNHPRLKLVPGELEYPSLMQNLKKIRPSECYHLAAKSFVSYSTEEEFSTMHVNAGGTHNLLSAILQTVPECRLYFAGTSEMFGRPEVAPQNENTPFRPRSIYGISKLVGHELLQNYRRERGPFASTGILFNHESERRGQEFVTRKITSTAVQIKRGQATEIRLGNIEARRDWGYAKEYVEVMHKILNFSRPEDFVVGTGQTHSVKEFLAIAFGELGLNYEEFVVIDERFFRPSEENILVADASKARDLLGWQAKTGFEEIVRLMVKNDWDNYHRQNRFF